MHSFIVQMIFYIFASITVLSAFMVITQHNPVRCVLFLVVAFFASSILWMLLQAEFLSLILILVYVGAVMTLFLFVVMMLDTNTDVLPIHFTRYLPFGFILVTLLVGLLLISVPKQWYKTDTKYDVETTYQSLDDSKFNTEIQGNLSNTQEIGLQLYTKYMIAFELAAALLLVAIVSAITLAHKSTSQSKKQLILKQLMVRKKDRIKLVSMNSDKNI